MRYHRRYYRSSGISNKDASMIVRGVFFLMFLPLVLLFLLIRLVIVIIRHNKNKKASFQDTNVINNNSRTLHNNEINNNSLKKEEPVYKQKDSLITNYERHFYNILENNFGADYKVQAQVNLASIINKIDTSKYQNELFRNIDFGLFDKETLSPLLLIEINDATHKIYDRYQRDLKIRKILSQANIKLITFYSSYDNEESYVVNRIKEMLQ